MGNPRFSHGHPGIKTKKRRRIEEISLGVGKTTPFQSSQMPIRNLIHGMVFQSSPETLPGFPKQIGFATSAVASRPWQLREETILTTCGGQANIIPKRREPPKLHPLVVDRFPTARTVQQMMETMERMMEDPLAYSGGWPSESGGYSRGRTPWEIKEDEGEYKIRFDMPGMTKDDVKLWVEEKMLVIKAEKMSGTEGNGEEDEGAWSAKSYGRYNSRVALPENVQFEKIKAEVKDGVLYITIPKASDNPKILDINVE
ncbi:Heat shock protein 21, chloroplastic [Vitis vinifera]|uniref:Heat shock protein 21, chloroplastic n=1 Tax=Vitis vinifera TaxID=29760 RepID=A0A438JRD6_VITVI|nr:Heat shock protein 21, chloroplastic [Vitis vinifera]